MTMRNQHGFTREKLCLTNVTSYNKLSSLMDEGKALNVALLEFSRASDTVFHKILTLKLLTQGQTVWEDKNWLNRQPRGW